MIGVNIGVPVPREPSEAQGDAVLGDSCRFHNIRGVLQDVLSGP